MSIYGDHPSPFIPGTSLQYAWDSTSLGELKTCPRKYQLSIVEGWRSKSSSVHLVFGGHFAKALERFHIFRAKLSYDDALDATINLVLQDTWVPERTLPSGEVIEAHPWESDNTKKNRETLIRSIIWYLEEYKDDPAQTVILADGKPAVELSFQFDSGLLVDEGFQSLDWSEKPRTYILSGHLDRLVTFGGDIFVQDQKTTSSTIGPYFFDQFSPHNQMTLYTIAGKIVYDMPISGVMIDAVQIAVGFTSFGRGLTMRSTAQLEEFLASAEVWFRTAEQYAKLGHWPMNEASCNNYGKCVFHDICNKDPRVREKFLETDFEKRYWNPLEPR